MAIESHFAFKNVSLRLVRHGRGEHLTTGIAADVAIDPGLEPHGVELVGKRTKARIPARYCRRGKIRDAEHHTTVAQATLQPPAVVDIDVAIAFAREPRGSKHARGRKDVFFGDVGREGIPRAPSHRRHYRFTLFVRAPSSRRREGIDSTGRLRLRRGNAVERQYHQCGRSDRGEQLADVVQGTVLMS